MSIKKTYSAFTLMFDKMIGTKSCIVTLWSRTAKLWLQIVILYFCKQKTLVNAKTRWKIVHCKCQFSIETLIAAAANIYRAR